MESLQAHLRFAFGGVVVLAFPLLFPPLLPFAAATLGQIIILTLPGLSGSPRFSISPQLARQFTICLAVHYSRLSETLTPFRLYFQLSKRPRTPWRCGGFLFTQSDALVPT